MSNSPARRAARLKIGSAALSALSKPPSPSSSASFALDGEDGKSKTPSPSPSMSPVGSPSARTMGLKQSLVAALRVPFGPQAPAEVDSEQTSSADTSNRRRSARLKTSVVSALKPPSTAEPSRASSSSSFRKVLRRRSSSFMQSQSEDPELALEEDVERSPSTNSNIAEKSPRSAVLKLKGLIRPSACGRDLESDEADDTGDGKSPAGRQKMRRRSSGKFKTVSTAAFAGLAAMTSLRSEIEKRAQESDADVRVQNPNEVLLSADDDDSDDEEEEEAERDFLSALQRVQNSGKLSMRELLAFNKELRQEEIFQDENDATIIAGLRSAKYLEVDASEVIWSRVSELCDTALEMECPIILLLSGKVSIAKPGFPEGEKLHKGGLVSTQDPDVLGIVAEQDCSFLYAERARVQQDMADARAGQEQVERELLRGRQPATWPEELINVLVSTIQHLTFFEDFAPAQLRGLARGLRYQIAQNGEALPQPLHLPPTDTPDLPSLVVLLEGKVGKYRRVSADGDELVAAQLDLLAPAAAEPGFSSLKKPQKPTAAMAALAGGDKKDGILPDLVPDLPDEVKPQDEDGKIHLKRYGDLRIGSVLGQRNIVDPGGAAMHEPTVRCEGRCKILRLTRRDYLRCLKEVQVEKQRIVHTLRNIPPSRPGEPHHRSEEQLSLLAKLVKNTPELKSFERPTLMQVLGAATYINAAPGHVLCKQGEIGDRFYAIIEGMVSIHVRPKLQQEEQHAMHAVAGKSGNSMFVKTMLEALVAAKAAGPKESEKATKPEVRKIGSKVPPSADVTPSSSLVPSATPSVTPARVPTIPLPPKGAPTGRRKGVRVVFGEEPAKEEPQPISLAAPATGKQQAKLSAAVDEEQPSLPPSPPPEPVEPEEMVDPQTSLAIPEKSEMPTQNDNRRSLRVRLQDRGGLFWQGVRSRMKSSSGKRKALDLGKLVNRLGAGAAFGAKTLLKKEARTASVMTVEPTKLLVVTREDYVALVGSMEEAKRREAAEFLCRHVLQIEMRAGSTRASDNLHPALRHRMVRTSKAMTSCSLDRGSVLLRHGEPECKYVTILRQGAVAYCFPPGHAGKEAPRSARSSRYVAASMGASQIVTTPGELIGVYSALFKSPEPATVRIESATCDIYRVPWADLQQVLTQRVVNLIRERMMRTHGTRCQTLAAHTPKEMFHVTANTSLESTVPSKEQQVVKQAFVEAVDVVSKFAEGSGEGPTNAELIEAIRVIKSSENVVLQSHVKTKTKALPGGTVAREAERKDAFDKFVQKALAQLRGATQKAGLWESLQTSDTEVEPARSRPPRQMGSSHVRAQFLKVLNSEHSMVMERFIAEAVLDPAKSDLNNWLQKYMKSERLRKHPDLQELQLILRRQLAPRTSSAKQ